MGNPSPNEINQAYPKTALTMYSMTCGIGPDSIYTSRWFRWIFHALDKALRREAQGWNRAGWQTGVHLKAICTHAQRIRRIVDARAPFLGSGQTGEVE